MSGPRADTLSDAERRVLDLLDEDALVATLVELVRIPSVGGTAAEVDVQLHCAELLRELGLHVDQWDIDLVQTAADPLFPGVEVERERAVGVVGTTHAEGMPGLVLQGHLDVVPAGDPDTWLGTDPFSGALLDGMVFGRGACDMKAGVAVNLAVVRTLHAAGVRLARPLAVHCVVGEEDGGLGGFATLRRGHRGAAAVITEPTSTQLITANAGALTFRIEVTGKAAHGSVRRAGVSAFDAFLPVHQALLALEADRNREPDPLFGSDLPYALSIGVVRTGEWSSSVPDRLVAEGRYGVMVDEDPRQARQVFEEAVHEAAVRDPWLRENRPVVSWPGGQFAGGRIDLEHPLVEQLRGAVLDTGGPPPELAAAVYGSDLRLYTGIGGIPTLHYGPGNVEWAHASLERVPVAEVVDVARGLLVLALRRCTAVAD